METKKPMEPLYYGARHPNTTIVHSNYANRVVASGCETCQGDSQLTSAYKYTIPKLLPKLSLKKPHREPEREFTGMNPNYPGTNHITFDSNFECGNLDMVFKPGPDEYDLFMRVDTNTKGHHQWFYYSISYDNSVVDMKKKRIKINILNFTKQSSMYQYG